MARKRMVSPELLTSPVVASLPIPTRYAFVALWMYFDDSGRGRDNADLIRAHTWPMDPSYSVKKVAADLDRMADAGLVCRYEAAGQGYLHSPSWREHQKINRPTPSRLPPCPIHDARGNDNTPTRPEQDAVNEVTNESLSQTERDSRVSGGLTESSLSPHATGLAGESPPDSVSPPGGLTPNRREVKRSEVKSSSTRASTPAAAPPPVEAQPDDDEDLDKLNEHIEGRIIELLVELTGRTVDRAWASKIRRQILDDRNVREPLRYISSAIRGEPQKYLPSSVPVEAGNTVIAHVHATDPEAAAAAARSGAEQARALMAARRKAEAS